MRYLIYIILILSLFFHVDAEEKSKTKSKKFDNWFLECAEINKKEKCELVQVLSVKESKIKFKFLYSIFKNQDGEIKEIFSIITPLGVNLIANPAIRFDGGKQYNSRFIKCEIFIIIFYLFKEINQNNIIDFFQPH